MAKTVWFTAALSLMALLLPAGAAAQCPLNPASPSVTICAPANGAVITSPVPVIAGTTDTPHPVTAMKVYLDSVSVYTIQASQVSTSLSVPSGKHNITVNAWDASGAVFKNSATVTVSSAPAPVSVAVSPTMTTLTPGQTQAFTATVLNTTNTAVNWSVDGVAGGDASVGTISASGLYTAGTSLGNHTVAATSQADTTKNAGAVVTVATSSTSAVCAPAAAPPSVTICNPAGGSAVTSPFNVTATAVSATTVRKFLIYLDSVLVGQGGGSSPNSPLTVDTFTIFSLNAAAGSHHLTAQFYTGTAWVKQSETFTVSTAPPPVSISITPSTASIPTGGTQQFAATVQNTSNAAVTWTVDGVVNGGASVGTITGTGATVAYLAPSSTGPHTVVATSVADATKFASAVVTVTSPAPAFPASSHVFVVMEENQSFSEVFPSGTATNCTSAGMPYLCGLAAANGMALNFYANDHGSLLDYLYNTSGSDWTVSPYNCNDSVCASIGAVTGDNIVRALAGANLTWRGYFEDMPSQGYLGVDTANYVTRHNPFIWYSDVANSVAQQDNMYPFTQFAVDLGSKSFQNFSYIVPNLLDDAHGTGTQTAASLMAAADSWLQTNIGPLLSANPGPFQPGGDGILIVAFDEAEEAGVSGDTATDSSCSPTVSTGCGGHVALVMIGPNVIPGSTTSNTYQNQDLLHTILHLLGITDYMNNTSGAADIALLPGT